MLRFAALADDLTGGMMIASLIEAAGVACPVVTAAEWVAGIGEAQAVVLARKLRLLGAEAARAEARAAAAAFAAAGARQVYQKYCATFDSTPAGAIGPIAEALMAATGAARTLFAPAFPERGVTVFQGRMFLGPTPLGESFKRHDPATPMTESDLVAVLQAQTTHKVGLLAHGPLAAGRAAAEAEMARQDARFFIADTVDAADVARLAEIAFDWPLVTGGDSLAPALARLHCGERPPDPLAGRRLLPPAPGRVAVLAGSCARATLAQLARFESRFPVRRIDLAAEGDEAGLAARILDWAAEGLERGPLAIATSADRPGVAAAQARFGRAGAAPRTDALLAEAARGLHALGVRNFVVGGGETSGAVVGALEVARFEVSAFDELGGGYAHAPGDGTSDPLAFVLKAGAMGGEDFLFEALARLEEANGDV